MIKKVSRLLVLAGLVIAGEEAHADPFLLVDVGQTSVGVEGGALFGRHRAQTGFAVGAFHPNDLSQFALDLEAYALVGITVSPRWYVLGGVGGGVTFPTPLAASVRSFWVLTGTADVAPRVSVFLQWTPETGNVFTQFRVGPSIRLGHTSTRLFPHAALNLSVPGDTRPVQARFTAGCLLILNF